jgi:hypothetical protein
MAENLKYLTLTTYLLVQLTSDYLVREDLALEVHTGVMRDNCRSLNTELELSSSVHRSIAVQAGI